MCFSGPASHLHSGSPWGCAKFKNPSMFIQNQGTCGPKSPTAGRYNRSWTWLAANSSSSRYHFSPYFDLAVALSASNGGHSLSTRWVDSSIIVQTNNFVFLDCWNVQSARTVNSYDTLFLGKPFFIDEITARLCTLFDQSLQFFSSVFCYWRRWTVQRSV